MATPAQLAANRANARKSTGPRTVEGKQRASMNPLKHGLTAATLVLPHEDNLAFQELRGSLYMQYQPDTPQECMLVDQLASGWWRTIRVRQVETDMLDWPAHIQEIIFAELWHPGTAPSPTNQPCGIPAEACRVSRS